MPENPLLPNARLRELFQTMQLAVNFAGRSTGPRLEATLAGTLLHLEDDDFVLPLPQSPAVPLLESLGFTLDTPQPESNTLTLATGAALALKEAENTRVAMTFTRTGAASRTETCWADALGYAQRARLPLLVVCIAPDTAEPRAKSGDLTWASMQRFATPLHIPVMPIDGADAVAVYRATQESILRARQGGGPAVLWCVHPATRSSKRSDLPTARLRAYLAARGLGSLAE